MTSFRRAPNDALADLMQREGRDEPPPPRSFTDPPPPPAPEPLHIEKADWMAEETERLERDAAEVGELAPGEGKLEPPEQPGWLLSRPQPKPRPSGPTPNLDKGRQWYGKGKP